MRWSHPLVNVVSHMDQLSTIYVYLQSDHFETEYMSPPRFVTKSFASWDFWKFQVQIDMPTFGFCQKLSSVHKCQRLILIAHLLDMMCHILCSQCPTHCNVLPEGLNMSSDKNHASCRLTNKFLLIPATDFNWSTGQLVLDFNWSTENSTLVIMPYNHLAAARQ